MAACFLSGVADVRGCRTSFDTVMGLLLCCLGTATSTAAIAVSGFRALTLWLFTLLGLASCSAESHFYPGDALRDDWRAYGWVFQRQRLQGRHDHSPGDRFGEDPPRKRWCILNTDLTGAAVRG